jgi:AraC-like DNA-binding protein
MGLMAHVRHFAGFKHFFAPPPLNTRALTVNGLGVHERMPPSLIRRPQGTGDYLLMLFHDEACAACSPDFDTVHPPETMIIWPPEHAQYYGNASGVFSHSWIHCKGTRVRTWLKEARLPIGVAFAVKDGWGFTECLLALYTELVSYAEPDAIIAANLLESGLREIGRQGRTEAISNRLPSGLLAARRQIGTTSSERLTLSSLATTAGLSVSHFCVQFRQAFGQSPIQCLIEHRLNHAAYLLADTALHISEIAVRVGYGDAFHFSRAFKRQFGKSPRALRRERHGRP